MHVLGTTAEQHRPAEDRHKFSALLDQLGIEQPAWSELDVASRRPRRSPQRVGYPVLVRPSYVLSGAAMSVATNDARARALPAQARPTSRREHPVVISKFIENAKEIELDGVARDGELRGLARSASTSRTPASTRATPRWSCRRSGPIWRRMRRMRKIAERDRGQALKITGPFNIQFIAKGNDVKVIECNLRASRSFPFVSKVCGVTSSTWPPE